MKTVYLFHNGFGEGSADMVALLGGKGAHLAEMSTLGLPVPPGFTIPTTFCVEFMQKKDEVISSIMPVVIETYWTHLCGNSTATPRLVSVRSGAPISMPGMMNTILNVGMTSAALPYWAGLIGRRPALDCRRRLIQMLGETGYGVPMEKFEAILTQKRFAAKVKEDKDLSADELLAVCAEYEALFEKEVGKPFPDTVEEQLTASVRAVFESWNNERARIYRDLNGIDHNMGTAVTVQAMVFGNLNDASGSGVLFTRNPSTGAKEIYGEFLANAQGEDVVAGIRTPLPIAQLNKAWPEVGKQIENICSLLESHYKDMMDVEFTVESGTLYMLQCRKGKRSAQAKLVIAVELFEEGFLDSVDDVLERLSRSDIKTALTPRISPAFTVVPNYTGIGATMGVAKGIAVLSAEAAINCKDQCILVREETDPDDIGGMAAAVGILTKTGGATSHAAVVARAMDKACVVGCIDLPPLIDLEGKMITIDALTGRVWVDVDVPVIEAANCEHLVRLAYEIASKSGPRIALPANYKVTLEKGVAVLMEWAPVSSAWATGDLVIDAYPGALPQDGDLLGALFRAAEPVVSVVQGSLVQFSKLTGSRLIVPPSAVQYALSQGAYPLGVDSTLAAALGSETTKLVKKAVALGADSAKVIAALQSVPIASIVDVQAAPPAYIVMSALKEE